MIQSFIPSLRPGWRAGLAGLLAGLGLLLTGCGVIPSASGSGDAPLEPTPTLDPLGYRTIEAQACLVSDWGTIQSERRLSGTLTGLQGELIAWQPTSFAPDLLAYLAPSPRSSWFAGTLMIAKGPEFSERAPLSENVLAAGDLTWSPSGSRLAFLGFRLNEGVYTVMTIRPDGSELTDLFPSDMAHTGSYTSQKAIIGWKDDQTLQVMVSCGEACRQAFDLDVASASIPQLVPTPVERYKELDENLSIQRNEQDYQPEQFPKNFTQPNWSPDGRLVVYLDKKGLLWLLSPEDKFIYPLDIGLRDVNETQWSAGSDALAVRAEDRIFVFQIPCRQ